MAINTERLYETARKALRRACMASCYGGPESGEEIFSHALKNDVFAQSISEIAPALEIYLIAKDELGKAKGGNAYSAFKRIIKSIPDSRKNFKGVWTDAEGRQCVCDGYQAIRLNTPVEGFETVAGMDLSKCYPLDTDLVAELSMPTPGELKINKKKFESWRGAPCYYDFGEDLPRVNANYLKNIMDCLPDAKAYVTDHPLTGPIIFKSNKGDALLLPVRKKTA